MTPGGECCCYGLLLIDAINLVAMALQKLPRSTAFVLQDSVTSNCIYRDVVLIRCVLVDGQTTANDAVECRDISQ